MNPVKNIRIMCPNLKCRSILVVPETARGKNVKCSNCTSSSTKIPDAGTSHPARSAAPKNKSDCAEPAAPDIAGAGHVGREKLRWRSALALCLSGYHMIRVGIDVLHVVVGFKTFHNFLQFFGVISRWWIPSGTGSS